MNPNPKYISIPKPVGNTFTGREEIKINDRWVNAATLPNYDDNAKYEWRVEILPDKATGIVGQVRPSGIEAEVCADIARRQAHGIAKYGTTVADNPLTLRQWLQHALEECYDQAVYLKRAIAEIDKDGGDK